MLAQKQNLEKDLIEYVDLVIKETEDEGKAVIEVLSPSSEDKTYETLGLSNKKESLLEETTPTKVKIEPRIEIKSGEEIENKKIKEENLPQKSWLKNGPKKSLPEGNEEEETQDEISAP